MSFLPCDPFRTDRAGAAFIHAVTVIIRMPQFFQGDLPGHLQCIAQTLDLPQFRTLEIFLFLPDGHADTARTGKQRGGVDPAVFGKLNIFTGPFRIKRIDGGEAHGIGAVMRGKVLQVCRIAGAGAVHTQVEAFVLIVIRFRCGQLEGQNFDCDRGFSDHFPVCDQVNTAGVKSAGSFFRDLDRDEILLELIFVQNNRLQGWCICDQRMIRLIHKAVSGDHEIGAHPLIVDRAVLIVVTHIIIFRCRIHPHHIFIIEQHFRDQRSAEGIGKIAVPAGACLIPHFDHLDVNICRRNIAPVRTTEVGGFQRKGIHIFRGGDHNGAGFIFAAAGNDLNGPARNSVRRERVRQTRHIGERGDCVIEGRSVFPVSEFCLISSECLGIGCDFRRVQIIDLTECLCQRIRSAQCAAESGKG